MPPVDQPKADPLTLLLDEIEMLSAQTRSLELSLKRAHTEAFEEVEKFQQQFRVKVSSLKNQLEDRASSSSQLVRGALEDGNPPNLQNEDLLRRVAEHQNPIQHGQEESERRGAAIVALREQVSRLEAMNRELEQNAALQVEQAENELKSQVTRLQAELTQKDEALKHLHTAMSQAEQNAQVEVRRLEKDLVSSCESLDRQRTELERNESERNELRRRFADLETTREQAKADAQREIEVIRHDVQAKIAALQSEIAHKTALLTQNQSTIARQEHEIKAIPDSSRSKNAEIQALLENHAAEIAHRNAEIAQLQALAQQQARIAADELAHARETFSAEAAALRSELNQKQMLLEQRQALQNAERELLNRNRELQGRLAAKESVIESQEFHLRNAQSQLLITRDTLVEKERALTESQARATAQEQHFHAQRNEWQCRLSETQLLVERYSGEIERTKAELAAALEGHRNLVQEQSVIQKRVQDSNDQVDTLANQLNEKQAMLERQDELLRGKEVREAELSAALAETRNALEKQQASARSIEQNFTTRISELGSELERNAQALHERDVIASRAEPEFKAQIDGLQRQLQEKDSVLEARAREIGILQARVESLSGQAARLEAAQKQALTDASIENDRTRQAMQTEIAALQSKSDKQQALLEERQTTLCQLEQTLRAEIEGLKERSAGQQTLLEKQNAETSHAVAEANALQERLAQLQSEAQHANEGATRRSESDGIRIATLEDQLRSTKQMLAERQAALEHVEQQLQNPTASFDAARNQEGDADQSAQLRAAQVKIAELLDRLAQLEAARHMLQENAGHELQQLRESFETRVTKLRMELAAQEQARPQEPAAMDNQIAINRLEEGFQKQIQELQNQLAEQHTLLENRNEELIKVKAELDALHDRFAEPRSSHPPASPSVELREEDAVDPPAHIVNGSGRPDPIGMSGAETVGPNPAGAVASNRFTHLEGRVRAWNPQPEKESAFGSGRRWNLGLFKRRWKA